MTSSATYLSHCCEYERLARIIYPKYHTRFTLSNAYSPQQNGVAERRIGILVQKIRAMLIEGSLPKFLWATALDYAAWLTNILPSTSNDGQSPYYRVFKTHPSLSYVKTFGCTAFVHIQQEARPSKLDPYSLKTMFVGLPTNRKGYTLMHVFSHQLIYSRDFSFFESEFPSINSIEAAAAYRLSAKTDPNFIPTLEPNAPLPPLPTALNRPNTITIHQPTPSSTSLFTRCSTMEADFPILCSRISIPTPTLHNHFSNTSGTPPLSIMATLTLHSFSCKFPSMDITPSEEHPFLALTASSSLFTTSSPSFTFSTHPFLEPFTVYSLLASRVQSSSDPTSWKDALSRPDKDKWIAAAHDEYNSLLSNGTYELVRRESSQKVLPCRWVFRLKPGGIYKARLVVNGFLQEHGVDYTEIFAPVVRLEVLRFLFTMVAVYYLECHQMDVKTAFLYGNIDCLIHMELPPGSLVTSQSRRDYVCRLKKSIYGLKQAPHLWYWTFVEFMLSLGFTRLHKDRCVFLHTSSDGFTIVSLYVDGLLIIASTTSLVSSMKLSLSDRFHMKDLGEARDILGWQIERNRSERTLFLHQTRYCETVVERFDMASSNPVHTPFESSKTLSKSQCATTPEDISFMASKPYRSLVGSPMYLAMGTRPDLAFPLQQLSQFLDNPGPAHWRAAKRALRYLNGTRSRGLLLGGSDSVHNPFLSAYVDADYANCPDTRRCVSGYVLLFLGSPISWLTKKQNIVTLSTTEAEFVALSLCIQECLYIQQLASELKQSSDQPVVIYEDNQSTIHIAQNSEHHGRSKHFDVRYMFVRDLVEAKHFELRYCNTKQQLADFFTKAHPEPAFNYFCKRLQLLSLHDFTHSGGLTSS
ncbi:hypothetical protein Ae201684_018174 [Aphanomyces euteiches]|uniref:Integrase catalytic domain-containing protein n=1 Tax=Aphanomyces euteiches TaxID=100861 RepID=A0A6G0W6P6_9STRA|nr:hypothetical protein Ae201684_018174 [Aphanomyces euteiches]